MTMRVIQSDWLFCQTDYRAVLRHAYAEKKKRNRKFSYSMWARQLGVRSRSTLGMMLNGQRHPGDRLVQRISTNLGFSAAESQYFTDLVALQKNAHTDVDVTLSLIERLRRRRDTPSFRFVDYETLEAISSWHCLAIRELAGMQDFREDPAWICNRLRFKISPKVAAQAVRRLLDLGMLKRDAQGRLHAVDAEVHVGAELKNLAIQRLHREALELSLESLTKVRVEDRDYQLTSLPMQAADLDEARAWIRKFQKDFCDRFEKRSGDHLFQLHLCLSPLTRRIE